MKFYILEPDGGLFGTKWAYGEKVEPIQRGDCNHCPVCDRPIGMLKWLPPHYLKLSSAKPEKWGDFLWGAGFRLLVSARFTAIYEAEGLSGIAQLYPAANVVRIGNKKMGDLIPSPPEYHLIEIVWNAANLDDKSSHVVRKQVECQFDRGAVESFERVVFEPGSWTGVDIFEARGLFGIIVVSERFRQIVEANALTNAQLIPSEMFAYDEHRPGGWYLRK